MNTEEMKRKVLVDMWVSLAEPNFGDWTIEKGSIISMAYVHHKDKKAIFLLEGEEKIDGAVKVYSCPLEILEFCTVDVTAEFRARKMNRDWKDDLEKQFQEHTSIPKDKINEVVIQCMNRGIKDYKDYKGSWMEDLKTTS